MKKILSLALLCLVSSVASAGDKTQGDVVVRTLRPGEMSLALFKNPTGESARTIVICVPTKEFAKGVLDEDKSGGMVLNSGSRIVLKNDPSSAFRDGSKIPGKYLMIVCE